MTNHSVNDLASSFVEMAKAYERLPQVENELTMAIGIIDSLKDTIQRLELRLIERNTDIANLQASLRAEEAKREDAELRFLECDDAKATLERTLEGLGKDIVGVLAAIQPIPRVEPAPAVTTDMPLGDEPLVFCGPFVPGTSTFPPDASSTEDASGQSEHRPTDTVSSTTTEQFVNASIQTVETQDHVGISTSVGEGVSVQPDPTIPSSNPASSGETVGGFHGYHDYDNNAA